MAHQRQIIRDAVAAALVDKTAAGKSVVKSRTLPYQLGELPVISVYTGNEEVDPESANTAPRELARKLEVQVVGVVKYGSGMDDAMDDFALEIETAMHADPYFGGAAGDSMLVATATEILADGDAQLGVVTLTYQATYYTLAPEAPADAGLDDFETINATQKIKGGVSDTVPAVDQFTVEAP